LSEAKSRREKGENYRKGERERERHRECKVKSEELSLLCHNSPTTCQQCALLHIRNDYMDELDALWQELQVELERGIETRTGKEG